MPWHRNTQKNAWLRDFLSSSNISVLLHRIQWLRYLPHRLKVNFIIRMTCFRNIPCCHPLYLQLEESEAHLPHQDWARAAIKLFFTMPLVTQYGSTGYIGMALVSSVSVYIRKMYFLLSMCIYLDLFGLLAASL